MKIEDKDIVFTLNKDMEQGIEILFGRYYKPLIIYAEHYVGSIQIAEDIVQDFFIKLWKNKHIEKLESRTLSAYMFTSVKNSCYSYINRKDILRNSLSISEKDLYYEAARDMDDSTVSTIKSAIKRLPSQSSLITRMVLLDNMKYRDVADKLDISINTVKTLLKISIKKIRNELASSEGLSCRK